MLDIVQKYWIQFKNLCPSQNTPRPTWCPKMVAGLDTHPRQRMRTVRSAPTLRLKTNRKQQFCRKQLIANWDITSHTGKECALVQEAKRYSGMLLASLRLSVVAITLLSWTMDGNSGVESATFPQAEGGDSCKPQLVIVLMNGSYQEEGCTF